MNDPSSLLRAADPLRDDSPDSALSPMDAQAIRREMIAAIPAAVEPRPIWRRPLALTAAAALVATVSGVVGYRLTSSPVAPSPTASPAQTSGGGSERRQLQFSTPGGTRIIWIFDDSLRLQEPMP